MPSPTPTQPLRAGLYMVIAMACFILNDSCIKTIGTTLPLGQIIAIRGVLSVLVVAVICAHQGVLGSAPSLFTPKVLARSLLDVAGTFMFLTALMHMPIANLTAILQSVPLAVVLVSVIFLKEKVGLRRTAAIVAGFVGVLLIVRPTPSTFTIYEILALGIVFILAFRDLITKRIPASYPDLHHSAGQCQLCGPWRSSLFGLYQGFQSVALWQFGCSRRRPLCWPRAMCSWFPRCAWAISRARRLSAIPTCCLPSSSAWCFSASFPMPCPMPAWGLSLPQAFMRRTGKPSLTE